MSGSHARWLSVVVAALCVVAGVQAATFASPITVNKISPSPFYDDEPVMKVTFKTLAPAPAGRLYFLWWTTLAAGAADKDCAVSSRIDAIGYKGGVNATIVAKLTPEPIFGDSFCAGPSMIQIFTQPAKANRHMVDSPPKAKDLAIYHFRILRQP